MRLISYRYSTSRGCKGKEIFFRVGRFFKDFSGGPVCLSGIFHFAASGSRSPEVGIGVIKWGWEADSR